jgi:hypothetical protein
VSLKSSAKISCRSAIEALAKGLVPEFELGRAGSEAVYTGVRRMTCWVVKKRCSRRLLKLAA